MEESIAAKELVPIVLAVAVWGPQWRHKRVQVLCDNMAVVQVMNAQNCKDPTLLHLLRCLHFFTAVLDITIWAKHIPGVKNTIADAVSRNHLQVFHQMVEGADPLPTTIPQETWELVVTKRPDWCSPSWKELLRSSLGAAWLQAPKELIDLLKDDTPVFARP